MAVLKLTDLEPREQMPGFQGRFLHTDRVTVVHWEVQEGAQKRCGLARQPRHGQAAQPDRGDRTQAAAVAEQLFSAETDFA